MAANWLLCATDCLALQCSAGHTRDGGGFGLCGRYQVRDTSPARRGVDPFDAVEAFWFDLAPAWVTKKSSPESKANHHRAELLLIEGPAYGVATKPVPGGRLRITLKALPEREIYLARQGGPCAPISQCCARCGLRVTRGVWPISVVRGGAES